MRDQDEMFERATELPAFMGCPAHMPKMLPGGFDGVERGEGEGAGEKAKRQAYYNRKVWTFCDGLFPIRHVMTDEGFMESCTIGGRTFKSSVVKTDNGYVGRVYDKGKCVGLIFVSRGKNCAKDMVHAAFRAYVKQLSDSGKKYRNRKGFLRKAAAAAAKGQQAHDNKGAATT